MHIYPEFRDSQIGQWKKLFFHPSHSLGNRKTQGSGTKWNGGFTQVCPLFPGLYLIKYAYKRYKNITLPILYISNKAMKNHFICTYRSSLKYTPYKCCLNHWTGKNMQFIKFKFKCILWNYPFKLISNRVYTCSKNIQKRKVCLCVNNKVSC